MKIHVTKQEIARLLSDKFDNNAFDLVIDDDATQSIVEQQDGDYDEFLIGSEFTAKQLVRITDIHNILKKALTDQNYSSKIPDDPIAICEQAADKFISELSHKERRLIVSMVNQTGFKSFAMLWQTFQTLIQQKI